ncbi:MAG TPA: BolA family protein [Caulobacteraceae bacterium]|jgi:BolA protein
MALVADRIRQKLTEAFQPERLDITDDSASHAGHAGAREGGESHFTVALVAAAFAHKQRVERQRMVNKVLAEELAGPVHALSVTALAPGEGA